MSKKFLNNIFNNNLVVKYFYNKILWIENDDLTPSEKIFSQHLKNIFKENNIKIISENDIRQYLNLMEIIKISFTIFLLNMLFIYHTSFNFMINIINYIFQTNYETYNILYKFPILYPLFEKKYIVNYKTLVLYFGNPPIKFLSKFYKYRKTFMIREISSDSLSNEDIQFQHNFNIDNITKGFLTWVGITKDQKFRLYSLNGYSKIYNFNELDDMKLDILYKIFLKPKIPNNNDFDTKIMNIDYYTSDTKSYFKNVSSTLTKKNLLPIKRKITYFGCNIKSYIFDKIFYGRTSYSYGFLSYQKIHKLGYIFDTTVKFNKNYGFINDLFYYKYNNKYYKLKLPTINVIATRSGCDKSNISINQDIILYQIKNMKIKQLVPLKLKYHPSMDIWIILMQSICNVIILTIINHLNPNNNYLKNILNDGIMLVHIHAFPNKDKLPKGYLIFGEKNPAISCGCIESSYKCFYDQMDKFFENIEYYKDNYNGSLFLEKDHGVVLSTHYQEEQLDEIFDNYVYGNKHFDMFLED